jgi:hypothetical protein
LLIDTCPAFATKDSRCILSFITVPYQVLDSSERPDTLLDAIRQGKQLKSATSRKLKGGAKGKVASKASKAADVIGG